MGRGGRSRDGQVKGDRYQPRRVLSSGLVVDGTGRAPYVADVVLDDGKIDLVAVGTVLEAEIIDCSDHAIVPGFVDIHTHSDLSRLRYPDAATRALQGITTEITGNCGMSPAPVQSDARDLRAIIGPVDVCPDVDFTWSDLGGYLDVVEATSGATNVVPLLGHGTLRQWALGPVTTVPDEAALAAMAWEAAAAFDVGVWGMSLGLMYAPGELASHEELVRLARVVGNHEGLLAAHLRAYDRQGLLSAVQEITTLAKDADVRLQISHLRSVNDPDGAAIDAAFGHLDSIDADIEADAYPYLAGHTTLLQLLPAGLRALGPRAVLAAVQGSPNEVADGLRAGAFAPESITIARCGQSLTVEVGQTLADLAEHRCVDWATAAVALLDVYDGSVDVIVVGSRAQDTMRALADPRVSIASDGVALSLDHSANVAHPRSIGTFPRAISDLLGHGLSIQEVVHKATARPARRIGLRERGMVAPGMVADIVVCSLPDLRDNATYAQPLLPPSGVRDVFVAGTPVVRGGEVTGARPGRLLRRH
jgi:N-acyl-D-aspartate/D-glutamate deacylase